MAALEQALSVLPAERPAVRFEILYNLGLAQQHEGSLSLARATFMDARDESVQAGLGQSELRYSLEVAVLQIEVARQAHQEARDALSLVRDLERRSFSAYTRAEVEIAACELYRAEDPARALTAIERAETLVTSIDEPRLEEGLNRCKTRVSRGE